MTELERKRLTTRVLDLLDASARAHTDGDRDKSSDLMQQACELDVTVVSAIEGGITIGEVPHPHRNPAEWAEYVAAQRDGLAGMEQDQPEGGE